MASFVLFDETLRYIGARVIDFGTDNFRAVLSNNAPDVANDTVLADIVELAEGNGYTPGGVHLTSLSWEETGAGTAIWQWTVADFSWTATGALGPFRYTIVYDYTPPTPLNPLIGYLDYGSSISLGAGQSFVPDVGSSGLFQMRKA